MPRILEIVRARRDDIRFDEEEAQRTGDLAVDAIMGGLGSDEWRAFMEHFGDLNPAQLKRLNAEDNTAGDDLQNKKRAYMLANAVCGIHSPMTENLDFRVSTIDDGLPEGPCDPEQQPERLRG